MAKGQKNRTKSNQPKLTLKQKKAKRAAKGAGKK